MSKGRELLAGASWMYASQLATVVVQMIYAAVTSRLVGPEGFAAYGVALAVGALALILANGGLGQAVGRMERLEAARIRPLVVYSGCLGLVGAVLLYVSAPVWSGFWGTAGAVEPLRLMSLSVLIAPMLGLTAGLLRRQGEFRYLALAVFVCNAFGMFLGAAGVFTWRTAEALLISNITAQAMTLAIFANRNRAILFGPLSIASSVEELRFSWKLTAVSMLAYCNGNIGKLTVSNFLPSGSLGYWNRADVVTTVPFMQVQNAIIQAIYPEFRHDVKNGARASAVWVDLLTLVAWLALPAAALAAVVLPPVAEALFGSGWEQASALSGPLALVAGLQILTTVLASAIEALGRFRWIWATQISLLAVYAAAAIWCFFEREWYTIILGLVVGQVIQHAIHLFFCGREGYLDLSVLLRKYARVLVVSGVLWLAAKLTIAGLTSPSPLLTVVIAATTALLAIGVLWRVRLRLEPVRIALKYRDR